VSNLTPFQELSYNKHIEHAEQFKVGSTNEVLAKTWFKTDTVDAWRHRRLLEAVDPILESDPNSKWLTVGDGRYGTDSKYLLDKGCDALASDISDVLLKEAMQLGYITQYSKENAESLSFADNQFDYVLCKESYHHFPRPMLALYEMLRVSRKAILLIEPNDLYITNKFLAILSRSINGLAKSILGKDNHKHRFEESGNYLYSLSRREVEKLALGLCYCTVAFKGINNIYFEGVEYEDIVAHGPLQRKIRSIIGIGDFICRLGLLDYNILSAIIFKEGPSAETLKCLSKDGYEVVNLPRNPFISNQSVTI
jgi:ubiquinone/menaquinone biosynthesis C-methylase UbiE